MRNFSVLLICLSLFIINPLMAQQDTVAPVITLIGGDTVLVGINNFFQEPGIIITDNADTITNYDSSGSFYAAFPSGYASAFGTYTIDYTAADNSNNLGTATRYIKVVDTISPTVTLNGSHVICIEKGNSYNDPGFNITDNYNYKYENFVVILEGCLADPNHIGTFRYRYTVIDSFNNAGYSEWRYVIVKAQGDTSACVLLDSLYDTCQHIIVNVEMNKRMSSGISIYPNPASNHVTIAADQPMNIQIRLLDLSGRCLLSRKYESNMGNTVELDISGFPPGVYLIEIDNPATGRLTEKLGIVR